MDGKKSKIHLPIDKPCKIG